MDVLAEDEAERGRQGFQGANTLDPPLDRLYDRRRAPSPPAAAMADLPRAANVAAGADPPPGVYDHEYCHPDHLADFKMEIPHLVASGKQDSFILRVKIAILLKMESNHLKRASQDKGRTVEDILARNQDAIASNPTPVSAGFDDRRHSLHAARFLPGPICSAQELWLQARRVLGISGYPPVAAFDLASVGLAGHITAKGFAALQDPSSAALSLRLFDVHNVTTKVEASKRITLSANDDSMEVGESLREASTLFSFQQAIRAVRELARFAMPWNHAFAALEGFLVCNNYLARDLGSMNSHSIGVLARFCDHIFALNAARWRASQPFIDATELGPTWTTWLASRGGPAAQRQASTPQPGSSNQGNNNNSQQKAAKPAKPRQRTAAPTAPAAAAARAAAAGPPDDICQRFNKNRCPNQATGNCTTAAGLVLRHVCNYLTTPTTKCLQPHARVLNH
jgi:hypothetical protein